MRNRRSTLRVGLLLATIAIFLMGVAPQPIYAQTNSGSGQAGLAVSPPIFEADVNPGQTITQKFSISNLSEVSRSVVVDVENFQPSGEEGAANPTTEESPFSIVSWTSVSPTNANIPAKGEGQFTATIKVPANPGPGGHFGALVFTGSGGGEGQVQVKSAVSALILLRTPGTATEKLSIASFDTVSVKDPNKAQTFHQKGPVKFAVRLENQGNVQVKPEIKIELHNMFGRKIATIPVEPQRILPNSTRRFEATWNHDQLLGSYNAKVIVTYGKATEPLTASTSFWGAPLGKVVAGLIALIVLFIVVWLPRKRWKKAFKAMAAGE